MSWSFLATGTPEKIAEAIGRKVERTTSAEREEFAAAAPHLAALIMQNFNTSSGTAAAGVLIKVRASGWGDAMGRGDITAGMRRCNVSIEQVDGEHLV